MPLIKTLLSHLKADYPQFTYRQGSRFSWSASDNTIQYSKEGKDLSVYLLHELSHAILGHSEYDSDIKLIAMERQAWEKTLELAKKYDISVTDEFIQNNLDSYRDWLHARSLCPNCDSVGLQTKKRTYKCPACDHLWLANEARSCALRRYNITNK